MIDSIGSISQSDVIGSIGNKIITNQGQVDESQVPETELKSLKKSGKIECETCKNRKYVDGSDDPGVSFKTPKNISAEQSQETVMGHEREHYSRNTAKAERENKEVVSCNITTQKAVCPECGKIYTAGGETKTVTRTDNEKEDDKIHFGKQFYNDTVGKNVAKQFDMQL